MANKVKRFLIYILIPVSMSFMSCRKEVSEEELIKYINEPENGLSQQKEVNKIKYEISYRPLSLILQQEFGGNINPNDSLVKEKKQQYEKYHYFILNLSAGEKDLLYGASGSFQNFSENLQKLSFQLKEFIQARTEAGDTLHLADYYMPNFYGMAKSTQILLAFEKPKGDAKELDVIIEELGFGTGTQKFKFRKEDIDEIPELTKAIKL